MKLKDYKGWTGEQRAAMYGRFKDERKAGSLPGKFLGSVPLCDLCRQPRGTMWHAEEYGPTFTEYLRNLHPVCATCHAMIHLRFRLPVRWQLYVRECQDGPARFSPNMGAAFQSIAPGGDLPPAALAARGGAVPPDPARWWTMLGVE